MRNFSSTPMHNKDAFLLEIYKLDIIKFGAFTLKSGLASPFYIDLRGLASNPTLLKTLSQHLLGLLPDHEAQLICGVPYAALPMATVMSITSGIPLIIKRKENKGYGTKKLIEGAYSPGQECVLVEDVVTSGKSLSETLRELERAGIVIRDVLVVIDREQGGRASLEERGYRVHTLFTITEIVAAFRRHGKLDETTAQAVLRFVTQTAAAPRKRLSWSDRIQKDGHPVGKKLLETASEKQTNLICAADLTTAAEVFTLAQRVADAICALKIHADLIEDFSLEWIRALKALAEEKHFLLFEDRKFADIGNTARLQFTAGLHRIGDWADLVTAHVVAGAGSLQALKGQIKGQETALVPIVEMSTVDALTDSTYVEKALQLMQAHDDAVIGAVAQRANLPDGFLKFTPGVHLVAGGDTVGQHYRSPEQVIGRDGADFIIVGRGLYAQADPAFSALRYRDAGWKALQAAR